MPDAWRQAVEDVCVITVGDVDDLVRLVAEPQDVVVKRGERTRLTATVASSAHGDVNLEAHLISPWGTWEWIGPATGAVLPARGRRRSVSTSRRRRGSPRTVVGTDPDRLRGTAALHPGSVGDGAMTTAHIHVAATVAGQPVSVTDVDKREAAPS